MPKNEQQDLQKLATARNSGLKHAQRAGEEYPTIDKLMFRNDYSEAQAQEYINGFNSFFNTTTPLQRELLRVETLAKDAAKNYRPRILFMKAGYTLVHVETFEKAYDEEILRRKNQITNNQKMLLQTQLLDFNDLTVNN